MKIILKTRLHDGIYASCGGGEVRVHGTWNIGPRNLLKAVKELQRHASHMKECYGGIGAGHSWLEYDNEPIGNNFPWLLDSVADAKWFISQFPNGEDLKAYKIGLEQDLEKYYATWEDDCATGLEELQRASTQAGR